MSITQAEYDKKAQELKRRQHDLNAQLQDHAEANDNFSNTLIILLNLASRAHELFRSSRPEQKNQLLRYVFSNLRVDGRNLDYSMRSPFDLLANTAERPLWSG